MRRTISGILCAFVALTLCGCGPEDGAGKMRPRKLSFLTGYEDRVRNIPGQDGDWIRDYLAGGGTLSEELNERKVSEILGTLLHADPPEELAAFVLAARRSLYAEFFYAFSDTERLALAEALRAELGENSILAEKYDAVLCAGRGKFPAQLDRIIGALPLAALAEPEKMSRDRILQIAHESGDPQVMVGAAGVLAEGVWVAGESGRRTDRLRLATAVSLLSDVVRMVPDDPAIRMAYVLLNFRADMTRAELQAICRQGAAAEPDNAAYSYLESLTLAEVGQDEEALAILGEGLAKPYVTFHDVSRAATTAAFLRRAGLGVFGARLASYRHASVDGPESMRKLSQRLREIPLAGEGSPPPVVLFPRRLSEQISKRPHLLLTELIRLRLLIGSWKWSIGETPDAPAAVAAREELERLVAGRAKASGAEAWDSFFSQLGEDGFRKYLDEVLFGHEPEFLMRCAGMDSVEDCAALLKE